MRKSSMLHGWVSLCPCVCDEVATGSFSIWKSRSGAFELGKTGLI